MGDATFSGLQSEVILALDNRDDAAISSLPGWINRVYRTMTHPSVHEFDELKETHDLVMVANQHQYPLDEATLGYKNIGIRACFYYESATPTFSTVAVKLDPRNVRWYSDRMHSNGPPRRYTTGEEEDIWVDPVPGSPEVGNIVRVHLWKEVPKLVAADDTTLLPAYFDEVLMLGSLGMAEFKLGYRDRSRETLAIYNSMLNNAAHKSEIEADDWDWKPNVRGEGFMRIS